MEINLSTRHKRMKISVEKKIIDRKKFLLEIEVCFKKNIIFAA
jgi:hypothetical protein